MRNQNVQPGEIVAIQGLGGLGHLALQYAAKMGYHVVALSRDGSKEKFARDLGAKDYVDQSKTGTVEALQKMGGAAMIVVTAPNPDLYDQLLGGLAPMGKLLVLGGKSLVLILILTAVVLTLSISHGGGQDQYITHDNTRSHTHSLAIRAPTRQRRNDKIRPATRRELYG